MKIIENLCMSGIRPIAQTPLLTQGASPPGPPDLHSEGTEALELTIQAEAQEPDL